jgi:F0F1-type ATP synthase membrane subunit b/b'
MGEVLRELLRQVTARPGAFAAEVVQAILLVAIVAWAGRRPIGRRLGSRRDRIAAELAEARAAELESARMRDEARALVERARGDAPGIVQAARDQAQRESADDAVRLEAEAQEAVRQARQTVEADESRVVRDASERLVRLTAETARRYLDEVLSESQRRALTDKVIAQALEEMERGSPPTPGANRRGR